MGYQKICVVGLGYIGLPTSSMFASKGAQVLGVDINPQIVETLNRGEIHIYEPGLAQVFGAVVADGKFRAALQPAPADAFIISVPTPFKRDESGSYNGVSYKLADMQAVKSAAEAIAPHLRKGNLVVLESTSPPRTTLDLVAPILEKSNLKAGADFHLCYSPERVLPGQILRELVENSRVMGGITPASAQAGADLYAMFVTGEIIQTDATTAEMVKLMENTYRDANIAIANEFSRLADRFGVDVWEAIGIANLHPRVKILSPGPGVGGHCISVDPWFLVEAAPELSALIYRARQVNDEQPRFLADVVQRALGSLTGKRIAALGLAYKPDVDDLRESPAVAAARILQERGAQVRAYEPFKPDAKLASLALAPTLESAIQNADALLLLVKHSQLAALNPEEVARQTSARIVVDAVQGWDSAAWRRAGFRFVKLGSGKEQ